jgi:hypothetical protein
MPAQRPAYTTDLSDEEWQILAPLLPPEKPGGRPRKYPMREVYQTCRAWRPDDTWLRLHDPLRDRVRTAMSHPPQPSAAILDAQSVQTPEKGGRMVMMGPRRSAGASALSALRRRVSSCVSLVHAAERSEAATAPWRHGRGVCPVYAVGTPWGRHGLPASRTAPGAGRALGWGPGDRPPDPTLGKISHCC